MVSSSEVKVLSHRDRVTAVTFSPDGSLIITAAEDTRLR